ncbi:MAG: DNA polymerase III subunit beta [Kiritimatiellae bacterium]|nr:DNA polymerase III subunit beta [Kiritimatiellia bacterium]
MKLRVDRTAILEGLQMIQSVVSTRTTLPILSNVLLKAEEGKLWMTTTDLEVSVRCAVEANVSKAGGTTLPARRLFGIVRELPSDEIELETTEKDEASIQCGSSFFKIFGLSEDEFPPIPDFSGGNSYSVEQRVLREMLKMTAYAASTDETRYALNGVLFSFKGDKFTAVATDGRRLALVEQEVEFPPESEGEAIVPSKAINELLRTLNDAEGALKIHTTKNQIAFEFGDVLIVSKLIEGTYPNFRQVIPSQCEERVPMERETLLTAVRRVSLLASEKSNSVKLSFEKNHLKITAVTPDVGEAHETVPVKYAGKEIAVAFNPEFIMDPLRNIASDEVYLELTDELSPGVMKCEVPFLYVLMPMRVN